jgi:hypothetical protein
MGGRIPDCDDGNPATDDWCDEDRQSCVHECLDRDGDGHLASSCGGGDCDDADGEIHPGAPERCNDLDDDCDGVVAEDRDGDGYRNDEGVCTDLDPWEVDCDDDTATTHPGAVEDCDGVDDNCVDGTDDEPDTDGDGSTDETCDGEDCDDEDPSVHPGADDSCNGVDDDCDGGCDDGLECCAGTVVACTTICGTQGDGPCSDTCTIPPAGLCNPPEETCNGVDDDCDDVVDEDLPCVAGEVAACTTSCDSTGTGICQDDCTPAPAEACNPPEEACNGEDDDCNDLVDEGFDCQAGTLTRCETTCGTTGTGTCTEACAFPEPDLCTPAVELACGDGEDNDCDGWEDCTDEDCIGSIWCPG